MTPAQKAAATKRQCGLAFARRDFDAERAADFDAWTRARLGTAWSPEAAAALEVEWYVDVLERRPDLCDPYYGFPFTDDQETYFASGSNRPGEIEGLARAGWNIGVAVDRLDRAGKTERALLELAGLLTHVFADSGAFGEVKLEKNKPPRWPKPISDAEWLRRLAIYKRLAAGLRHQLWVVAPDRVADQVGTLNRQAKYREQIREIAALGAHVIVPVQKDPAGVSLSVAWMAAQLTLGPGEWIPGLPMRRDATPLPALVEFIATVQPAAVHLLGLGPSAPGWRWVLRAIRQASPGIAITCDSVFLRRMVGRENGPGGGPRAITAARDEALALGITDTKKRQSFQAEKVASDIVREQLAAAKRMGWFDPELEDEEDAAVAA